MKKMYNIPEVEVFEFDAEIQMSTYVSNIDPGMEWPLGWPGADEVDPGITGPDKPVPW